MGEARRVVAAFDFDGTLTARDSLMPFLAKVAGRRRLGLALVAGAPAIALALAGRADRGATKAALLARLVAGHAADDLRAQGDAYAAELVPRLHPALLERIDWHRGQGHELVLVSASLGAYLQPLASRLGFTTVLATEMEVGDDGRLTGHLVGLNVRGEEKLRRLEAWLGGDPRVLWAYGDSAGDRELLAAADNPHWCRRGRIVPLLVDQGSGPGVRSR